nr:immunoglobulin heavy chain junction region [Mus musculus]NSM04229.1 immunoglobulin heavy chain junction region [Mus musculus]NSM05037.1 immunoglobulin heavy chain junction region [Mus musculus]NSM05847.1 immunoglobulin heavy chain junction region [Mus musculus]NSM06207.1 immunoglobulin heavy chain junction region [Mus musculus]
CARDYGPWYFDVW